MGKSVLVTGFTGSGKSTLREVFRQKDYITCDIDRQFAHWVDKVTEEEQKYHVDDADMHTRIEWRLKEEDFNDWLETESNSLVMVFGTTDDLYKSLHLFDKIFLLEYTSSETLKERLASRPIGGYGKTTHECDAALSSYLDYQSRMKQMGAITIDCTLPPEEIVKIIENEVNSG